MRSTEFVEAGSGSGSDRTTPPSAIHVLEDPFHLQRFAIWQLISENRQHASSGGSALASLLKRQELPTHSQFEWIPQTAWVGMMEQTPCAFAMPTHGKTKSATNARRSGA